MKEHPYMYAGDNVRAVFRVAMEQFALNFAPDVTVPEPQRLREKVKNALKKRWRNMNNISKGDNIMNQLADNKKIMDFLLYSYFGFSSGDLDQTRKIKCSYRAYLDLNRRIAFKYSSSELDKMQKENTDLAKKYKEAKHNLVEKICSRILSSVPACRRSGQHLDEYQCIDEQFGLWHKAKCEEIMGTMNTAVFQDDSLILKSNSFTYGLAQKWVNMTLKYLWLLDMLPEDLTAKSLHVPIDSFILKKMQEDVDEIRKDGDTYKYKGKSWSQLDDYDVYLDIQAKIVQIAGKTFPIEWEGPAWMDVAKTRSSK